MNLWVTLHCSTLLASRIFIMLCMLPIITVYQDELMVTHAIWVGFAVGCYGLTQAIMQLIMGYLSDVYGRIKIIQIGLFVFFIGSLIPVLSLNIYTLIASRLLQGLGAIGAVVTAWLQELVPTNERPLALAIVGLFIGISFITSFGTSVWVVETYSLSTLVNWIALFSLITFLSSLIYTSPSGHAAGQASQYQAITALLASRQHMVFFYLVFCLHQLFACHFCFVPASLKASHLGTPYHYTITLVTSFLLAVPVLLWHRQQAKFQQTNVIGIGLAMVGYWLFYWPSYSYPLTSLTIFFTGFNILEAIMPNLLTSQCQHSQRGLLLGLYYTFQYLGIFSGGMVGGVALAWSNNQTLSPYLAGMYMLLLMLPLMLTYRPSYAKLAHDDLS
ncbi:MAG: hypothetical protein CMF46_03355 [Legionellales bacterium]|nr:hypothetical protein [Legionellales bacterium]